jgi:hypothetical protein
VRFRLSFPLFPLSFLPYFPADLPPFSLLCRTLSHSITVTVTACYKSLLALRSPLSLIVAASHLLLFRRKKDLFRSDSRASKLACATTRGRCFCFFTKAFFFSAASFPSFPSLLSLSLSSTSLGQGTQHNGRRTRTTAAHSVRAAGPVCDVSLVSSVLPPLADPVSHHRPFPHVLGLYAFMATSDNLVMYEVAGKILSEGRRTVVDVEAKKDERFTVNLLDNRIDKPDCASLWYLFVDGKRCVLSSDKVKTPLTFLSFSHISHSRQQSQQLSHYAQPPTLPAREQ